MATLEIGATVAEYGKDKVENRSGCRCCVVWLIWILHVYDIVGDVLLFNQIFNVTCCRPEYIRDSADYYSFGKICADDGDADHTQNNASALDKAYCKNAEEISGLSDTYYYYYYYYSKLDDRCDHEYFNNEVDRDDCDGRVHVLSFDNSDRFAAIKGILLYMALFMIFREATLFMALIVELCSDKPTFIKILLGAPLFPIFAFLKPEHMRELYNPYGVVGGLGNYRMIIADLLIEDIPGVVVNVLIFVWFEDFDLINLIAISGSIIMVLRSCWAIRQANQ